MKRRLKSKRTQKKPTVHPAIMNLRFAKVLLMRLAGKDADFVTTSWLTLFGPMKCRSVLIARSSRGTFYCTLDELQVMDEELVEDIRSERQRLSTILPHEVKYPEHHWSSGRISRVIMDRKPKKRKLVLKRR